MPPAYRQWSLAAGAVLSLAAFGHRAFGEPAARESRVALVFGDGLDENRRGVVHDLPLELRAEGIEVPIVGKVTDAESVDVWAGRARSLGVRALIHVFKVSPDDASIEVLLVEPTGLRLRNVIHYAPASSANVASLSAVEVTRAALLSPPPSPPPTTTPEVTEPLPKEPTPELATKPLLPPPRLSVSVLPTLALGGAAPLALLDVAGTFTISSDPGFEFDVDGALPAVPWSEHVVEGTARARMTWIDAGGSWFILPTLRWLRPFMGLRAGAILLSTELTGSTTLAREQGIDAAFFGALSTGVSLPLVPSVRLRVQGTLGFAAPALSMRVADTVVDHVGFPLFQFGLGPELVL